LLTAKGMLVLGKPTEDDMRNYEEIMKNYRAMRLWKDPRRSAANKGDKWRFIKNQFGRNMRKCQGKKRNEKAKKNQKN